MTSFINSIETNKNLEKASFSGIANVIEEANRLGNNVIRLEVGDVDFDPPQNISLGVYEGFEKKLTHYPPLRGYDELIEAIVQKIFNDEGISVDKKQVLICSGGSMGIFLSIQTMFNSGDDILILEPIWPHLTEMLVIAGLNPIIVHLNKKNGFRIDVNEIEQHITPNTKGIIINTPNNPTGVVYTESEIKELVDFCKAQEIVIVSDEEYYSFTYDSNKHISPLKYYEATIVCRSFSKSLSISGLRLGYIVAPEKWIERIIKLQLFTTMYSNSIIQYAVMRELSAGTTFVQNMVETFEKRVQIIVDGLRFTKFICNKPEGSVYVWVDCSNYNSDDRIVAKKLLYNYKVAVVPGSCFGEHGKGFLRISLGNSTKNIEEAVKRIKEFSLDEER